ncbi:MAG: glycerol-3-phosphate 1-O-acyltransferase PlsY [Armatimonadetes bacterium]|nr:glycerol-3-phosphate 1-O-acyltransferase PlsY [Armatimonadota bacterium]
MDALAVAAVVFAYFLGGVPVGLVVARRHGVNLFKVGSGNIGTTNVVRALGVKVGLLVWLGDVAKGLVAALVALVLTHSEPVLAACGAAVVTGHCWSPYLRFRGGRGIATSLGVLLVVDWRVGLLAFALWILVVVITKIVSVASLAAAVSLLPLASIFHPTPPLILMTGYLTCLAFYRHKENIERLLRGEEHRFGGRKKAAQDGCQREQN